MAAYNKAFTNKAKNFIILASGNGSNAVNLINRFLIGKKTDDCAINIAAVISNVETAPVIEKIKRLVPYLPIFVIPFHNMSERDRFEKKLEKIVINYKVDFIVLAGFMKILSDEFVLGHLNKIINIHPSLLPAFKGKDAIKKAFDYGVKYTGVTVHFVTSEVDSGPIIYQEAVKIEEGDDINSLELKIHKIEHEIYPLALKYLINKDLK